MSALADSEERLGDGRDIEPHLNYVVHPGDGPAALLLHGILGSRSYWNDNLAALSRVCRPVVMELWGHGGSPSPSEPSRYLPQSYVAEFEHIRTQVIAPPGEPVWLIGQSMGAAVLLHYALTHPENVIGVVLTNSASAFSDLDTWAARTKTVTEERALDVESGGMEIMRDSWINPGRSKRISADVRAKLDEEFSQHSAVGVVGSFRITNPRLPLGDQLADISVPVLLTNGVEEERFQPLLPQARKIPGIEIVDLAASHAVNAHNPTDWNAAVTEFMRRVNAGG